MMKPEFSKLFDLADAKSGAPYCCRDGDEATVFKWDGRHAMFSLTGVAGIDDTACSWRVSGSCFDSDSDFGDDLVMLPLGLIDGKPVFVGDELRDRHGNTITACVGLVIGADYLSWPALPRVYPVTQMTAEACWKMYADTPGHAPNGIVAACNAALRHAVDSGQLIEPCDRAARDMAVAEAVQNAAMHAGDGVHESSSAANAVVKVACNVERLDLAAIIASIDQAPTRTVSAVPGAAA